MGFWRSLKGSKQFNLGLHYYQLPAGDRGANLQRSIDERRVVLFGIEIEQEAWSRSQRLREPNADVPGVLLPHKLMLRRSA